MRIGHPEIAEKPGSRRAKSHRVLGYPSKRPSRPRFAWVSARRLDARAYVLLAFCLEPRKGLTRIRDVEESRTLLVALLCVAAAPVCSYGQAGIVTAGSGAASAPPLWGNLRAGSHGVGFRTLFRYDRSRTWKPTRTYDGTFSPDLAGRRIQVNVWYPALADKSAKKMRFVDYVDQSAPDAFWKRNDIMRQRNRDDAMASVPRSEIPALQMAEMNAYRDAPSA
jgi:hypothetical protein